MADKPWPQWPYDAPIMERCDGGWRRLAQPHETMTEYVSRMNALSVLERVEVEDVR